MFDVKLESNGSGWAGTFGLTVEFFAKDILSDGAPFEARITWDHEVLQTFDVTVFKVENGALVCETKEPRRYVEIPSVDILILEA